MTLIGKTYDQYGYPEYCGWIEGLLLLEPKNWSQKRISERLGEIFPASKYPTSVPSVNRALKILETYGIVERAGSRKTGYRYRLVSSSNLVSSMFQQFITLNQSFIQQLEALQTINNQSDPELAGAIHYQVKTAETWSHAMQQMLTSLQDNPDDKS